MKGQKYIIVNDGWGEQVLLFSTSLTHANVARGMQVVSAGFYYDGKAYGESISLGVVSRMDEDTQLIHDFLALTEHKE
jgi:hypothetical protein